MAWGLVTVGIEHNWKLQNVNKCKYILFSEKYRLDVMPYIVGAMKNQPIFVLGKTI